MDDLIRAARTRIKKKQEEIQRMHELDFATGMLVQQDD